MVNNGRATLGRVLIVSYYYPPAGGGGVQRVLKLCKHLPELGWDVEVLAPDDPKWVAHDPDLEAAVPDGVIVHRARYRGPSHARSSSERLASATGWRGIGTRGAVVGRKLLLPDAAVLWAPSAARAAVRIVHERKIDLVLTSSPPSSVHIVGNRVTRRTGIPWIADFRDSWLANPHRRYERRSVRAKREILEQIAHRTVKRAAGITAGFVERAAIPACCTGWWPMFSPISTPMATRATEAARPAAGHQPARRRD